MLPICSSVPLGVVEFETISSCAFKLSFLCEGMKIKSSSRNDLSVKKFLTLMKAKTFHCNEHFWVNDSSTSACDVFICLN